MSIADPDEAWRKLKSEEHRISDYEFITRAIPIINAKIDQNARQPRPESPGALHLQLGPKEVPA